MSDGIGCQCYARCSSECGCENVDWTPREVIELRNQLSHLQKLCEEHRVEIADRADTERSMAQAMLEDGEKIKELESQLAEKEKEKEKEIERLNRLLELTKNKWIEDTVKEGRVVLLQSQLATQTERVRVMREALELASKANDIDEESGIYIVPRHEIADKAKQVLNQKSLGDGKDEYCTCGTDPRTWKTCRRHKESLGDGGKGE